MDLTHDDIRRLANLCRLELSEEEVDRYSQQLTGILGEIDKVRSLDTQGVPETSQVSGLSHVLRADEMESYGATPDELLACSPMPVEDHSIQINRIL